MELGAYALKYESDSVVRRSVGNQILYHLFSYTACSAGTTRKKSYDNLMSRSRICAAVRLWNFITVASLNFVVRQLASIESYRKAINYAPEPQIKDVSAALGDIEFLHHYTTTYFAAKPASSDDGVHFAKCCYVFWTLLADMQAIHLPISLENSSESGQIRPANRIFWRCALACMLARRRPTATANRKPSLLPVTWLGPAYGRWEFRPSSLVVCWAVEWSLDVALKSFPCWNLKYFERLLTTKAPNNLLLLL